jgi:hypothetical protein
VLVLEDIPELEDQNISTITYEIASIPSKLLQLRELHLSSSDLTGAMTGEALAELMLMNESIEKLSLCLTGDWKACASHFAKVLRSNRSLKDLRLYVPGNSYSAAMKQAVKIVKALGEPSATLKALNLCLQPAAVADMQSSDCPLLDATLVSALEAMVQCNHTIQKVSIFDDRTYNSKELMYQVNAKLRLNATGLSQLLYEPEAIPNNDISNTTDFDAAYVNAIAKDSQNLDLLFFALSAHPDLCQVVCDNTSSGNRKSNSRQHGYIFVTQRTSFTQRLQFTTMKFLGGNITNASKRGHSAASKRGHSAASTS